MGIGLLEQGDGAGVGSDDVTARREHVLAGYSAVTADSDDEVVEGTIPNKEPYTDAESIVADNAQMYVRLLPGAYLRPTSTGRPEIIIHLDKVAATLGVDASRMVESLTIARRKGQIVDRGEGGQVSFAQGREDWAQRIWATFRDGWYHRPTHPEGHESYIYITFDQLANLLGIDQSKMLKSLTLAGRQGNIEDRGSYIDGDGVWYYGDGGFMVSQIPPGYYRDGNGNGKTNVNTKKEAIVAALGLNPDYWLDNFSTMGIQGKVPRWVCTTGDIISAWGGEGHAYDDPFAGRGRGIVVRIPNMHRIEGANWVFLPIPNLQPPNIRAGVNVAGVIGTMPDLSAGGAVFHNATFVQKFATGVAEKGLNLYSDMYRAWVNNDNRYDGVQEGGMRFFFNLESYKRENYGKKNGIVLMKTINMKPFRTLRIQYKCDCNAYVPSYNALPSVHLEVKVIRGSSKQTVDATTLSLSDVLVWGFNVNAPDRNSGSYYINEFKQIDINVSAVNEHCFLLLSVSPLAYGSSENIWGKIIITSIEVLN